MKNIIKNAFYLSFSILVVCATVYLTKEFVALRPQTLPFVGSILEPFSEEGVQIRAKAYSPRESMIYLNRDLLHRGLQPLQVTIQNNTGDSFYLSNSGLDLPNMSSKAVAGKLTRSAIPRAIALRIAGFFFWPLLIPATIDSIITTKNYFDIRRDYYAKSIKDHPELIVPYSTVNRVIFLPADQVADEFTLYLQESNSGFYHPFEVEITG
jgi:hypothetical protein